MFKLITFVIVLADNFVNLLLFRTLNALFTFPYLKMFAINLFITQHFLYFFIILPLD